MPVVNPAQPSILITGSSAGRVAVTESTVLILAYARLYLACGEQEQAQESLAQAKAMIEDMDCYRQDEEVADLERGLESLNPLK
jgi:hypothetical protein